MLKSSLAVLVALVIVASTPLDVAAQKNQLETQPLTRVREGGTPYDPNQSLHPYALNLQHQGRSAGIVASPPEYEPVRGVLYKWASGQWTDIVTAMVVELTGDPSHDEIAYVVVTSTSQRNAASSQFAAAGADLSKVEFLIHPSESIWMRDYGPHFVWVNGTLTIADSHYYPNRFRDNYQPALIAEELGMEKADQGLYYSGGNFQPGPNRSGFVTSLVNLDNPTSEGFDAAQIEESYSKYQGIDTLHVVPQLPFSVDGTGHIDMWMYMIDEDTVIISEFKPGSNSTAIDVTNNTVPYMESLGFEVFRPEAWNSGSTHYTYANAYRVNDRIFIPCYGTQLRPGGNSSYNDEDARALATWQAAAGPDIEIVPIQCIDIIWASGAIHCIVKQVPRYAASGPATHVMSPAANDVLIAGDVQTIRWTATDTDNAAVPTFDLYYSTDGGDQWQFIDTVSNVSTYDWTVPDSMTSQALVRVVATATDSDVAMDESEAFTINPGSTSTYTFATGAGVDKWLFGTQTGSWNSVTGNSNPVSSQISSTDYSRLVSVDNNRYVSANPGSSSETTYVMEFEISESPGNIAEMIVQWDGYSENCTQMELYIWDFEAQQWGDGEGVVGQNRYLDNYAGNADGNLTGTVRSNFCNYVGPTGIVRFLVYGERPGDRSFHNFASLAVKSTSASFNSLELTQGVYAGDGDPAGLFESDNVDLSISRDRLAVSGNITLLVQASGKCDNPSTMSFTLEGSVFARQGVTQSVEMYNYDSGAFEEVDSRAASRFTDSTATITPTGDLSRFVESGTGNVQARVKFVPAVARASYNANIDMVDWAIE